MTPTNHIGWAISQHILIIITTITIALIIAFSITLVIRAYYFLNIGADPIQAWCQKERTLEDVMKDGDIQRDIEGNSWVEGVRE